MTLSPTVLALVLLAAVFHATWNAMVKSGGDKLIIQTLMMSWATVPAAMLVFFVPIPAPESWPWLAVSIAIHLVYYLALVGAYQVGDLSRVYPIARGSAPLLVALGAFALAGEGLSGLEVVGVAIVSAGILSLAWRRGGPPSDVRAVALALLTGLAIASYSVADAMGARASGTALGYIAWMFLLEAIPLVLYTSWRRGPRAVIRGFGTHVRVPALGGLISSAAYGIVIWAMSVSPMAHVVALRETSVIIAALIGVLVFGEGRPVKRIAAASVVVMGSILLQIGG